jgi:polynucleotide 5'-kinase involved in rRNA processing
MRLKRLQNYFKQSKIHELSFSQIRTSGTPFLSGRILSEREREILSKKIGEVVLHGEYTEGALYLVVERKIPKDGVWRVGLGKEIIQSTSYEFNDTLVGVLNRLGEVISIGVIIEIDFFDKKILLKAPIDSSNDVKELQFSDFRVKL